MADHEEDDVASAAEEFVYDLGANRGLVMRELVPEMHTQGPQKCYREKATDDFTGWTIWAAATLKARWIAERPELFAGKDCIELGAGCGLTGLAAACCTPAKSVVLSDYPKETMENLLYNTARNCERIEGHPVLAPPPARVAGAKGTGPITTSLAGKEYSLMDTFRSPTGCLVSLSQMDWDETDTWPRKAAATATASEHSATNGDDSKAYATYDVVIMADLFYRRSYSRKVATAVQSLLRPGGIVIVATPTAREGLQTLDTMMAGAGFTAEETPFPAAMRVNPLRRPGPRQAMLAGLGLERLGLIPVPGPWEAQLQALIDAHAAKAVESASTETSAGADDEEDEGGSSSDGIDGDVVVPLAIAGQEPSSCPNNKPASLHFVGDSRAKGMFPEMFVPSYSIVSIIYRPRAEGPEEDGDSTDD